MQQARKYFKYRAKKAKEFGILDYQHKNKDQLQHQINFANIHAQVKKDCDSHKSSPNNQLDIVMDPVNVDNMVRKSIKKSEITLVIGMAYCRDIVNQFKEDDSEYNLCECVGENNKIIETSVARDTFRCMKIDEVYLPRN